MDKEMLSKANKLLYQIKDIENFLNKATESGEFQLSALCLSNGNLPKYGAEVKIAAKDNPLLYQSIKSIITAAKDDMRKEFDKL